MMGMLAVQSVHYPVLRYWTISLYMLNLFELQVVFSCTGYNSTLKVGGLGWFGFFNYILFLFEKELVRTTLVACPSINLTAVWTDGQYHS